MSAPADDEARDGDAPDPAAADARPALDRRTRWAVALGSRLLAVLARTWRLQVVGRETVDGFRAAGRPLVYVLWHGEMLPLVYEHRHGGAVILISSHKDGEVIARIAGYFGFGAVRGSTSRGGGRALLALVRELRAGRDVAVTPDGPRGPALQFAPGALVAAQRAGVPVVTVRAHASRAWRLRSWDRFMIPKPFARVTVVYGAPTPVEAVAVRDVPAEAPRFAALMAATGDRAAAGG